MAKTFSKILFYRHELVGSVSKAEMLYKTNLVALVGGGKKPRFPDNVVMVYDDKQQEFVLELSLNDTLRLSFVFSINSWYSVKWILEPIIWRTYMLVHFVKSYRT